MTLAAPQTITSAEVPVPTPGAGEVLLEIARVGICGSDIHAYYGKHPFISLPVTPGHEFSGTVAALGPGAEGLVVGDRVTAMPQLFCGTCPPCRAGRYNICEQLRVIGCQSTGAMAEYLALPASLCVRLPDAFTFDQGAMLEPLAVGIHAARRAGDIRGKHVLTLGAGTIGNLAAQAARALGAAEVMITDVSDARLALARDCGVTHTVNVAREELSAALERAWGEARADVILECVGTQSTMEQAVQVARKGSDIVVAGVFEDKVSLSVGLVQDRELRLIGTLMYTEQSWRDAVAFVDEGKVTLEPLMSRHFPLAGLAEAFRFIERNRESAVKIMVDIK